MTLDEIHKIAFVNENFLEFFGIRREDVIGHHIVDLYRTGLDNVNLADLFAEMLVNHDTVRDTHVKKGEDTFFFRIKSVQTVFDDGCRGDTIVMENITQEMRYREELEANEAKYREVVETQSELINRFLPDGTQIFCNEAFCRYFGLDRESIIGSRFVPEIPEGDREAVAVHFASLTKENPAGSVVHRVILPEGKVRWLRRNNLAIFTDGHVREYQSVSRDITEQRRLREEEKKHLRTMEFLFRIAMEYAELPDDADIFRFIGERIREVEPDAFVIITDYDDQTHLMRMKYSSDRRIQEVCSSFLGFDPAEGIPMDSDSRLRMLSNEGEFLRESDSLFDFSYGILPKEICDRIQEEFGLGHFFDAGLTWKGKLLGRVVFFLLKGQGAKDRDLLKTIIVQAAIALQRQISGKALLESEKRFRSIAELSPFPVSVINPSGRYLFLNRKFTEVFGYTPDDFSTGRQWFRLAFPDERTRKEVIAKWKSDLERSVPGEVRSQTFAVTCKDGSIKDIIFRLVTVDGGVQFVVYEDITLENKAARNRALLASIVQSCDDAIIGKKVDGTVISWNPAAERIYGYSANEMVGRSISVIVPRELEHELSSIMSRIRDGEHIDHYVTRRIRKDGSEIDVSVTASPITDQYGEVIGASSIVRNITQDKAEELLKESEERYRALVENLDIGVYRSTGDPAGHFVWGNSNLVKLLGYESFEDLKEIAVSDVFLFSEGRKRLLEELRERGFVKDREIVLKKRDGRPQPVSVTALARFAATGEIRCVTGIVVDISEKRRVEQDLTEARHQIQYITDSLPDPALITDKRGYIIAWNKAMERISGLKSEEMIEKSNYAEELSTCFRDRPILMHLIDDPEIEEKYSGIMRIGENVLGKTRIHPPESEAVMVLEKASPLLDQHGRRIGTFESIHDISEWNRIIAGLNMETSGREGR
ncbi:MAG: PAS domain S-box protein [Methanoregulaceae archaeon]|nr:PAS domain S-box protein [Methanoregulaceae archaeon]